MSCQQLADSKKILKFINLNIQAFRLIITEAAAFNIKKKNQKSSGEDF